MEKSVTLSSHFCSNFYCSITGKEHAEELLQRLKNLKKLTAVLRGGEQTGQII